RVRAERGDHRRARRALTAPVRASIHRLALTRADRRRLWRHRVQVLQAGGRLRGEAARPEPVARILAAEPDVVALHGLTADPAVEVADRPRVEELGLGRLRRRALAPER